MQDIDIEQFVVTRIRTAVESVAEECLREVNAAGHEFEPDSGAVLEWFDRSSRTRLAILCSLGVTVAPDEGGRVAVDPVVEAYLELAGSGDDCVATVLSLLEGDIANGGFLQLLDNKERSFVLEAIGHLRTIGAQRSAALVEKALEMVKERSSVIRDHDRLCSDLADLEEQFFEPGESIPELVLRHREGGEA